VASSVDISEGIGCQDFPFFAGDDAIRVDMAKYERFEDLPAWKEAARLYNRVLDLFEQSKITFSAGFRGQLDRAALSVSNNIAEGFERGTTAELISFLVIAKGSAGEVRSMIAVLKGRATLRGVVRDLEAISDLAESCSKQLMAWIASVENSSVKGKRYSNGRTDADKVAKAARDFRLRFLRSLKPEHPLYNTDEAREARRGAP
jgi:four helix bundle protein